MTGDKVTFKDKKRKTGAFDIVLIVLLTIWAIIVAYPFYNAILVSLVPRVVYVNNPFMLYPKQLVFDSFNYLFHNKQFLYGFRTTGLLVMFGVTYSMLSTITLGYGLAKQKFPGKNLFLNMVLFPMYFSGGLIPYYVLIMKLGLIDSLAGLILPAGINTFYLLIVMTYFRSLPNSLFESAAIDGANELHILFKIVVPISMPIIATITLFYSVDKWNEWFLGMLIINDMKKMPLQVVLRSILIDVTTAMNNQTAVGLQNSGKIFEQGIKMACVAVTTIPVLLFYPFAQKYFVKGIMLGSIKS